MQVRIQSQRTYLWWSLLVIGRWFLLGVGFILAGLLGKIDLRLGLLRGGAMHSGAAINNQAAQAAHQK